MASRTQPLGEALQTGISLPTRTIYMIGTIDEDMFKMVHLGLSVLDREDSVIDIVLNSNGGFTLDGLAIYDALRAAKAHIRITAMGYCHSMAAAVLQAGDERLLSPNCRLMLHECSSQQEDRKPISSLKIDLTESNVLDQMTWKILSERTGRTQRSLKSQYSRDSHFSAQQAVTLGLADAIVS